MINIAIRGGIVTSVVSICCILPFLLLFFLGFQDRMNRNGNLVETTCITTNHTIVSGVCTEDCNCRTTCTGGGGTRGSSNNCHTTCQTCEYDCYDGFVTLEHRTTNGLSFRNDVEVYSNSRARTSVENDLVENYPINGELMCFYNSENPSEIRLELHNDGIFLGFAITFLVLGVLIFFAWIGFEAYIHFK